MYDTFKHALFLFVPLAAWLLLSFILFYFYLQDKNKRKLVFAIGTFVSAFGFYNTFIESLGTAPLFPSTEWLFIPISLAVAVAALSSLFKIKNFKWPFTIFVTGTVASVVAFFVQFPFSLLRLTLMLLFMAVSVPILMYIFLKSRDSSDLYFLLATLCFLFQGLVADLGTSVDIPVLLALFGVVFIALMFHRPKTVNPSNIPSFIVLETKLKEANQNLKTLEAKLLKAERLAAIGELAGIIGHDLRNPLQGIMGATHYLRMHTKEYSDVACTEMLNEIDDCIKRSDKIINDLIEYSQAITLHPVLTDPKTLTTQSLKQVTIPANIEIINNTTAKPTLKVDDYKIEHAFAAIIKNAFDAMPNGGKLTINSKKSHDSIIFSFCDTGIGMNEEILSKLWLPLFTTKAKGMGFGLAVCKRLVEAHGGQITAKSSVGQGTIITVVLPLTADS
jgi:signal transduction histidine kinase